VSFGLPLLLICLIAIPIAVVLLILLEQHRRRRSTAWAPAALLPNMTTRPSQLRRHLPTALTLLGVALLLVGFARPKATYHVKAQEATLVLVLDVSGSMAANDAQPTRFAQAKAIAQRFIAKAPTGYRLALVTFSDHAAVAAAPTRSMDTVSAALARARTGPQGTALADAAARAVHVASLVKGSVRGQRPPAAVVVLSDGGQTAGRISPEQAAARARQARIPVSSILLGTPDGIVQQKLKGGFTERIQVPAQPQALEALAQGSGGRFTGGAAAVDVKGTYDELGSRTGKRKKTIEVSSAVAGGGLAFVLAGGLLSGLWFRRIP
jgi:Ca-activated chloride channel family protein